VFGDDWIEAIVKKSRWPRFNSSGSARHVTEYRDVTVSQMSTQKTASPFSFQLLLFAKNETRKTTPVAVQQLAEIRGHSASEAPCMLPRYTRDDRVH